jgi:hypothetical protein
MAWPGSPQRNQQQQRRERFAPRRGAACRLQLAGSAIKNTIKLQVMLRTDIA